MHPVMRRLIAVKWKIYGKRGAIMDMALNLIYTMLWTIIAVTTPRYGHDLYLPLEDNIWRFIIAGMIVLFTLMEIKRQVTSKKNFLPTLLGDYIFGFAHLRETWLGNNVSWFVHLRETWLGNNVSWFAHLRETWLGNNVSWFAHQEET
jgi:hypothetical protein